MRRTPRTFTVVAGLVLILGAWTVAAAEDCQCPYQCDYDADGFRTVLDLNALIDVVFGGRMEIQDPACPVSRGDFNNSTFPDAFDLGQMIDHLFAGAPPPVDPCGPSGTLIGSTGCKSFAKSAPGDYAPADSDCVEYDYDGQSVLHLSHINAGFNCCPDSLTAEFLIEGGSIVINEFESLISGGCDCLCLFDVDYQIVGLPPGEYTIRINGQYLYEEDERIEFTVDLTTATSGKFCLYRGDHYPWGIY